MDPARWELIKAICLAAADRDDAERRAYIDDACAGDTELRREVTSLLDQMDDDEAFLDAPVFDLHGTAPRPAKATAGPRQIGPYELVRPLGHGGMGEVFLGVRQEEDFRQSVAVKVIRRGMDTADVLGRFRVERQILATLHHPNIAQLLDGGATDDGRPYFVMEYIEGSPVTEYCDRNALSVRARLELFQVICGAVHHAHQSLVVHRDIKPSNILVDSAGVPKLLDFGIGKVLDPGPGWGPMPETRTEARLLTPEYASPEQVRGEPVTTATDVYALGILLYQMLTGRHPYLAGQESLPEVERAICETDPTPPSTAVGGVVSSPDPSATGGTADQLAARRATNPQHLRRRLIGDLDTIALKALRKEPARRYHSAAALAEDIQRHLDGLPVKARPDTLRYRVGKFLRRNTWKVAAATAGILALGSTTIVTLVQSQRVAAERNRALEERDKALEVRGFLLEMFGSTGADRATGDTISVRQLLDRQVAVVDEQHDDDPVRRAEMLEVLAEGYDRLGLYDEAEPLAREALSLRKTAFGNEHPDVARALNLTGWIVHERGESGEARPLLEEAVAIRRAAGERYRGVLSRSLNDLGIVLERLEEYETAETLYREALDIRLTELGPGHRSVGITANNMATVSFRRGRLDSAVHYGEMSVRALRQALGDDHQRSVIAQSNLALFKTRAGDHAGAEIEYRDLVERQRRLQGADHPVTAMVLTNLSSALYEQGKYTEAETTAREALAIRERRLGRNHPDVASALISLASALFRQGKTTEALGAQDEAVSIYRQVFGPDHGRSIRAHRNLAAILFESGDYGAAVEAFRELLARQRRLRGPDHAVTARVQYNLARALSRQGEYAEAETLLREALATREKRLDAGDPEIAFTLSWLADAVFEQGRVDEAVQLDARTVSFWRARGEEYRQELGEALANLARHHDGAEDFPSAIEAYREAVSLLEPTLGRTHARTIRALHGLGRDLLRSGRTDEAVDWLQRAHHSALEQEPPNPPFIQQTRLRLAEAYLELDDYRGADSLLVAGAGASPLSETDARLLEELQRRLQQQTPPEPR